MSALLVLKLPDYAGEIAAAIGSARAIALARGDGKALAELDMVEAEHLVACTQVDEAMTSIAASAKHLQAVTSRMVRPRGLFGRKR